MQLIDLDAAMGRGDNASIVSTICGRLPCRVGGGIRRVERAQAVLASGAHAVIASSALFRNGTVDLEFAKTLADAVGPERVIAAVDSKGGQVVIHGWKTALPITAVEAVQALEPYSRRVPLHPRGHRRHDAGHEHGRHSRRPSRHHEPRHGRRRHHDLGGDRRRSMPTRWTPWWAWRSTRGNCRSNGTNGAEAVHAA